MIDLKPCPFLHCKGEADMSGDGELNFVECTKCHAFGPPHAIVELAAQLWNARDESTAIAAVVQAEREAIFSDLQALRDAAEEADDDDTAHGIGIAQAEIRARGPSPAVDVIALVREWRDAATEWDAAHKEHSENPTPQTRDRKTIAMARLDVAELALSALVDGYDFGRSLVAASPKAEKKDGGE